MKKFFVGTFKFLWAVIYGLIASTISIVFGIVLCATLIGIPFGVRCFKMVPLLFKPCGKKVKTNFKSHKFLNCVWLIPFGLIFGLLYFVVGLVCIVSIIFIPVGLQLWKIMKFYFAPFGATIIAKK